MRYILLLLLAPLATAQTLEIDPQDAPIVIEGRCNAGIAMPTMDLDLPDTPSMPVMPPPDIEPVPMPNLCNETAVIFDSESLRNLMQNLPPLRFEDFEGVKPGFKHQLRGRAVPRLPFDVPRGLSTPLIDPLVAPSGERP